MQPLHNDIRVIIKATKDVAGTQGVLVKDERSTYDYYQEGGSVILNVPDGTDDLELSLLGLTDAQFLFIEVDGEVQIRLGDVAADQITIRPPPVLGVAGRMMLDTSGVDSLYISNNSGATVRVWYGLLGTSVPITP